MRSNPDSALGSQSEYILTLDGRLRIKNHYLLANYFRYDKE